jgi:hypothetical protein
MHEECYRLNPMVSPDDAAERSRKSVQVPVLAGDCQQQKKADDDLTASQYHR